MRHLWIVWFCVAVGMLLFTASVHSELLNYSFSFTPDDFLIEAHDGSTSISLKGEPDAEWGAGAPALPAQYVNILLPVGAQITGFNVAFDETVLGVYANITPYQPPVPLSSASYEAVGPNPTVYQSASPFPEACALQEGLQRMRGYRFVPVRLQPVRWIPLKGTLLLATNISIELELEYPAQLQAVPYRSGNHADLQVRGVVEKMVINPELMDEARLTSEAPMAEGGNVDYLIITDDACSNAFQQLADYRTAYNGWSTKVLTVTYITANYSGLDTQEKIRACIQDYTSNNNLSYVVLGGDDTLVPDRNCYVSCGDYTESSMPTDLYYSGLDGTWDEDGDGVYGEANYSGITDEGDLAYDVIVGRIPVRTAQQASDYIQKMKDYESEARPPESFFGKMMLTGEHLWDTYTGADRPSDLCSDGLSDFQQHDPVSDAEIWMRRMYRDDIKPYWEAFTEYALFTDTQTSWDSSTAGDYLFGRTEFKNRLNEGWHFINMYTHGNWNIWGLESSYCYSSDAAALTNLVAIVYTEACITGKFDGSDPCLSEAFIRNANGGAVIYIGSSRYGWGSPGSYSGGTSAEYAIDFYDLLFHQNEVRAGVAFAEHKAVNASAAGSNGAYRWLQFSLNLQGDPGLTIALNPPSLEITAPVESAEYSVDNVLTVHVSTVQGFSSITGVVFRVNDAVVAQDNGSPFSCVYTTAALGALDWVAVGHSDGSGVYTSQTVQVYVRDNFLPAVSISAPTDGAIYEPGESVTLTASASDPDGVVTQVLFYGDGGFIDLDDSPPYAVQWWEPDPGSHTLYALARDNVGGVGTSEVVTFYVRMDACTELFDGSSRVFDLDGFSITFYPTENTNYSGCIQVATNLPVDPTAGTVISLSDDGSQWVDLGTLSIPFFGVSRNGFYINSNGNITFDSGDTDYSESIADHFDQERISAFFDDMNPSSGGTVYHQNLEDRAVVTYYEVPEYGKSTANTCQIELFEDGLIRLTWLGVVLGDAVVGLSAGQGTPADFQESDLSAYGACSFPEIEVSTNRLSILEGTSGRFYVRLTDVPQSTCMVEVSPSSGGEQVTGGSSGLCYTVSNWNEWQEVTIESVEDADTLDGTSVVSCTSASLPGCDVIVESVDNDTVDDKDGDVIPDWWEWYYFGDETNAVPDEDADNDGLSNREEWISGMNPTNEASVFATEQAPADPGAEYPVLMWASAQGREYDVLYATNLMSGFQVLATNLAPTLPVNVYTDAVIRAEARHYYRVRVRVAK